MPHIRCPSSSGRCIALCSEAKEGKMNELQRDVAARMMDRFGIFQSFFCPFYPGDLIPRITALISSLFLVLFIYFCLSFRPAQTLAPRAERQKRHRSSGVSAKSSTKRAVIPQNALPSTLGETIHCENNYLQINTEIRRFNRPISGFLMIFSLRNMK